MTVENFMPEFIQELLHVPGYSAYKILRLIQGAVDFKVRIPKSYMQNEDFCYIARDFGINSKADAKELREKFITEIIKVILESDKTDRGDEMLPDHYARLFHALAILKVPKGTRLLPGTTTNLMYDAMYTLWELDDGSDHAGEVIQSAGWYMAEEIKKRTGQRKPEEDERLLIGIRI